MRPTYFGEKQNLISQNFLRNNFFFFFFLKNNFQKLFENEVVLFL